MSTKLTIGIVAGLAVGLGAGVLAGGGARSDRDDLTRALEEVERERDDLIEEQSAAKLELETVRRRLSNLDRDHKAALAAAQERETAKAEKPVEDPALPETPEKPGPVRSDTVEGAGVGEGQTFSFPEYDEHLATVNWTEVGGNVGAMAPLLAQLMDGIEKGQSPSPEVVGSIQRHNGPLVTVAMKLHGKLPGETVNGAFTHPSAVVNIIAATLESMGKPLTEKQVASLERIGRESDAEDKRRIEGYDESTLALRRMADESLLKGRMYDASMAVLTQEQHDMLRPEATRGRVTVDLFSASLVWVARTRPIPFKDRAQLAEILGDRISRSLELEGDAKARLVKTVDDWTAGLPDELLAREPDALWLKGLMPIDAIDLSAQHQVVLMERILSDVELSEQSADELRGHKGVFVPTWRPNS